MNNIQLNTELNINKYESSVHRLVGYLYYLFDRALYVCDGESSYYVKTADLVEKFTHSANFLIDSDLYTSSKTICRLVNELLNPTLGVATTAKKISEVFKEFRSGSFIASLEQVKERQGGLDLVKKRLHELKNRDLAILPFDREELLSWLKPGDIFFKKIDDANHNIVVQGQKLIQPLVSGPKEREGYKYSHVAIYLGNGKIAEATPHNNCSEVRIIDLKDSRFALDSTCKNQYQITRAADEATAQMAAKIAEAIAVPIEAGENRETTFKYTKFQASRSLWHSASFGPFARYRYLKQYIDDHRGHLPKDFMDLKDFFCSYFVGYCFQTAESRRIMPKLLGENDSPIRGLTTFDTAVWRGLWARVRRIEFWREMSEQVHYKFDAKRLTPQDLRNFVINHPDLFADVFAIRGDAPPIPKAMPIQNDSFFKRYSDLISQLTHTVMAPFRRAVA